MKPKLINRQKRDKQARRINPYQVPTSRPLQLIRVLLYGGFMRKTYVKRNLVLGVGKNDADYAIESTVNGKRIRCEFYLKWRSMLMRCYSKSFQEKHQAYAGCSVCEEWLTFSAFKAWMSRQDWKGKHLDKDLLFNGNKIYAKDFCVFVDSKTNNFILESGAPIGNCVTGATFIPSRKKFRANCRNNFTGKNEFLGYFKCQHEAHEAWRTRKHELACQLADLQTDERAADALRKRYAK